jgi:hypothetical protein
MKVESTVFLCGYFSAGGAGTLPAGWSSVCLGPETIIELKNYYSPGFVDFFARDVSVYVKEVGEEVRFRLPKGEECLFRVDSLRLLKMPGGLYVSTIKLVFDGADLNVQSKVLSQLRRCRHSDPEMMESFVACAISPLDDAFRFLSDRKPSESDKYSYLVENGNKFKLFQIIQTEELPDDPEERDLLLFSAGTLDSYSPGQLGMTDSRYFSRIMQDSRIAVFTGWTALALLDTFTVVSKPMDRKGEEIWEQDYFGMLYLYELYRKCTLYHYAMLFHEGEKDPTVLKNGLDEFERKYTFTSVSYNFLPTEIDRCLVKGMEMDKEGDHLSRFLDREVEVREADSDRRREHFLLFLTLLAGFSAVWDLVSLLDKLIGFGQVFSSDMSGYRLATSILLLVIAYVAFRITRKKRV